MILTILTLWALGAVAASIDEKSAPVIKNDYQQTPEGNYQYALETGNGILSQAQGVYKPISERIIITELFIALLVCSQPGLLRPPHPVSSDLKSFTPGFYTLLDGRRQYIIPEEAIISRTTTVVQDPSNPNQKFLVALSLILACAHADVGKAEYAPIVRSSYDISPEGAFQYSYETGNGIVAAVDGKLKNVNSEYPSLEFTGNNKYTAPDGTPIETTYVANENGYQPQGAHIPVSPPIPEAILRSLQYIAAHPPSTEVKRVYRDIRGDSAPGYGQYGK